MVSRAGLCLQVPWVAKACQAMELNPKTTRSCIPRTHSEAERFSKYLLEEWTYVMPYGSLGARNKLLQAFLPV